MKRILLYPLFLLSLCLPEFSHAGTCTSNYLRSQGPQGCGDHRHVCSDRPDLVFWERSGYSQDCNLTCSRGTSPPSGSCIVGTSASRSDSTTPAQRTVAQLGRGFGVSVENVARNNWFSTALGTQIEPLGPRDAYTDIAIALARGDASAMAGTCPQNSVWRGLFDKFVNSRTSKRLDFSVVFTEGNFNPEEPGTLFTVFSIERDTGGDCVLRTADVDNVTLLRLPAVGRVNVTGVFHFTDTRQALQGSSSRLGGASPLAQAVNVGLAVLGTPLNLLLDDSGLSQQTSFDHRTTTSLVLHPTAGSGGERAKPALRFTISDDRGASVLELDVFQREVVSVLGPFEGVNSFSQARAAAAFVDASNARKSLNQIAVGIDFSAKITQNDVPAFRDICQGLTNALAGDFAVSNRVRDRLLGLVRAIAPPAVVNNMPSECLSGPATGTTGTIAAPAGRNCVLSDAFLSGRSSPVQSAVFSLQLNYQTADQIDWNVIQPSRNFSTDQGETVYEALARQLDAIDPSKARCFREMSTFGTGDFQTPCAVLFYAPWKGTDGGAWHILRMRIENGAGVAEGLAIDTSPRAVLSDAGQGGVANRANDCPLDAAPPAN